ncbi:MAG: TerB family tellurite resistance protein [Alphaproteobacteria bacterium]|nr:TerB family tellurite resistance protein [Alphaproteobacteria bacterium]
MSPLGKLTFSVIGLKLFGISGFLWGLCLGHILLDRTVILKFLFHRLNNLDDNMRLMLPYKYYNLYDKFFSHFFGKVWGIVLGAWAFGWIGAIALALLGHFIFDMQDNEKIKHFKCHFKTFFDDNLFKFLGFTLGFSLQSKILLFTGIILGFFIDFLRSDSGLISKIKPLNVLWPRANFLKMASHSQEAKKVAFIQAMTVLAAKLAKADGIVSRGEVNTFKKLFFISSDDHKLKKIFEEAQETSEGYEPYAKQIKNIIKDDLDQKEDVIDNLFKIISADGICLEELNILKNIAKIIDLPEGNFEAIRKRYEIKDTSNNEIKDYYKTLGVSYSASNNDIRIAWRELTTANHPDKVMAKGGSEYDIAMSNMRMAEINEAYQQIMKQRNQKR